MEFGHARESSPLSYIRACILPRRSSTAIAEAQSKYCEIRSHWPDHILRIPCMRVIPRVLVHVGELRGLIYASDRGRRGVKRTYVHFMEHPPILACNPRGDRLYVVGGRYRITRRGIEG
jgi:hypothetical protein